MDDSRFRWDEALLEFRIRHTLDLGNGKCACTGCRKLFRSKEFLNMHFDRMHALELLALKQRVVPAMTGAELLPSHSESCHAIPARPESRQGIEFVEEPPE
jgi:hypothetical protein